MDQNPDNTRHAEYRTWQINQPIVNNNIPEKLDLTDGQVQQIKNSKPILELYPDVSEIFKKYIVKK